MKKDIDPIKEIFKLLEFLDRKLHCDSFKKNFLVQEGANYVYDLMEALNKDSSVSEIVSSQNLQEDYENMHKSLKWKIKFLAKSQDFFPEGVILQSLSSIRKILSNPEIQNHICNTNFLKKNSLYSFSFEKLHHTICERNFNNIYSAHSHKIFWVAFEHNDTFIRDADNSEGDHNNWGHLRLTVLSEDMLNYDSSVFEILSEQNNELDEINPIFFRPYFSEYYIDTRELNQQQRDFLLDRDNHEGWFNAYLVSNDETNLRNIDDIAFDGVFAYSASPVRYKAWKLVIQDRMVDSDFLNKIGKTYSISGKYCSSEHEIKAKLYEIFKDVTFYNTRIYNVGNGNCISLYGKYGKKRKYAKQLLYDIGYDNNTAVRAEIESKPFPYSNALRNIRNFTPDCVILSHWDADHYKGCAYGRNEIFNCIWIAPDIVDANVNAKRLGVYMYIKGKIKFVDRSSPCKMIDIQLSVSSRLILYIGSDVKDLSRINCEGIAVLHEGLNADKKMRCLMQGDVPYTALPASADFKTQNPFEYLIVPHHGSQMDYELLSAPSVKKGAAVISCTNKETNIKDRPNAEHLEALNKCYKAVLPTSYASCYIQLDLRKENAISLR